MSQLLVIAAPHVPVSCNTMKQRQSVIQKTSGAVIKVANPEAPSHSKVMDDILLGIPLSYKQIHLTLMDSYRPWQSLSEETEKIYPDLDGNNTSSTSTSPSDQVSKIFADLTDHNEQFLDSDKSQFDLGFDSVIVLALHSRLAKAFGLKFPQQFVVADVGVAGPLGMWQVKRLWSARTSPKSCVWSGDQMFPLSTVGFSKARVLELTSETDLWLDNQVAHLDVPSVQLNQSMVAVCQILDLIEMNISHWHHSAPPRRIHASKGVLLPWGKGSHIPASLHGYNDSNFVCEYLVETATSWLEIPCSIALVRQITEDTVSGAWNTQEMNVSIIAM
ncbi:hypothetical protein ARMSODRAFT_974051 [Armillaria solidipes]|uniref:Carrier domain-containing protein n=1 Tax=Armillaria solidipes TaxID=1076256 RepID=A0A2H3BMA4_9AGAR|nr:hypothetical protein ARMSODRAFT_974051 [Armillaria solidipes]